MTRQPNVTVAATTQPLLVLQQSVSKEGAHEESRKGRGGHGATAVAPARRDHIVGCCHHWIIEVAILPVSKGVCQVCGEERLFRNQIKWAEIAPVKAMNDRRPACELRTLEQRQGAFLLKRSRYEGPVAV